MRWWMLAVVCVAGMAASAAPPLQIATKTLPTATVGQNYSTTLSASGGTTPYSWSGTAPANLSVAQNGSIAGVPARAGTFTVSVTVADSAKPAATATAALSLVVNPSAISITTTTLPSGMVGTAYSASLTVSGGTAPFNWALTGLPAGLSANGATISGVPTSPFNGLVGITVSDSTGGQATATLSLVIAAQAVQVTTTSLPGGTVGSPYSATFAASGGTGTYTWSITGSLPGGLTLSGNQISGTPTTAGTFPFTVKATDSATASGTQAVQIVVANAPVVVTTSSLPNGTIGSPYSQSLAATGGTGTYTWSISGGSLPAGLSLTGSQISGTPSAAGTASFTVKASDSAGASGTKALQIVVANAPVVVTTSSLPSGTVGSAYSQTLAAAGGTGTYTWSVSGGNLPGGLSLTGNQITGTPSAAGTFSITVKATDSAGSSGTQTLQLVVGNAPIVITAVSNGNGTNGGNSLLNGTVGTPYSQGLVATGGTGNYTWSISGGNLPAGLSLNGSQIGGTPTTAGTSSFTIKATDSSGASGTQGFQITVLKSPVTITTTSLSNGTVGSPYSQTLSASGGTGNYTWSIANGSLPAGLSLGGSQITGTPSTAGNSSFKLQVTDGAGSVDSQQFTIMIAPAPLTVTTSSLSAATVSQTYQAGLTAKGGTPPYSWSISSGSLPAGVNLSGASISGTPTAAGTFNFSVRVTDSTNATANQALTLTVNNAPLTILTTSLPAGMAGTAYSQTLASSGGAGNITWSVSSGTLPPGLALNANHIGGTPTSGGSFNFTIKATDTANGSATQPLSISIANAPVTITTQQISNGTMGVSYAQNLTAAGGTGTYTWSVTMGALPPGLNLVGAQIAGSPTVPGSYRFTLRAADTANGSVTQSYSMTVFAGLTVSACSAGPITSGQSYSATLTASGGAPPYQWSIAAGQLPSGLSLSSAGQISGTPSQAGTASFAVKVTDSNSVSALENCSLTVSAPLSITSGGTFTATQGSAFSQGLSATGGQPPYTWSVSSGSAPPGISLTAGGQLQGAAAAAGSYAFEVTVTDKNGGTAKQNISIRVVATLTIAGCPSASAQLNQAYSATLSATGGQAPYTWSLSGQLPQGLNLDPSGSIGGTPLQPGTFSFSVAVKDATSQTATKSCSLGVSENLSISTDSLSTTIAGTPYSQQITAVGGTPPYAFATASGSMPPGVNLSGSGQIAGTPSTAGSYSFTVKASDAAGATTSKAFTLQVVAQVTIGSCPASSVIAGQAYSGTFTASGGQSPYTFSLASGVLPTGIRLNSSTGVVSGASSSVGNYNYSVQVADKNGSTATATCSLNVLSGLTIMTAALSDATVQSPFVQVLQASGGQPPYNWNVASGSLPPGLTLNSSTGVISGTPTQTGPFTFTVAIGDASSATVQKQYTITVAGGLIIPACPTGTAEVGFAYAASLSGAGGNAPYTFGVNGTLPPGLTFNSDSNSITGTPGQAGSFPIALTLTDKSSASATRSCTLDVRAALKIVTSSLTGASTGGPYVTTLAASGGVPPYSWATAGGALPPGLFLNAGTGQITGTPTIPGQYAVTIQLADSLGAQTTTDFTVVVGQGLVISDCPTPAAMLGQPYSAALVVGGGTAPYMWSVSQGSLPPGLSLQSSPAMITGTPTQAGTFPYALTATDSASKTATRSCNIQISSGSLTITTATALTTALVGQPYSQPLAASGGNAPYSWAMADGTLPDGIALDPSGTLSGTATTAGSYQFSIQVTDQDGATTLQMFTLNVQAAASPSITVSGLPDIVGAAQQPMLSLQLSSGYPAAISGTVTLSFVPDPTVGVDDPSIQFATGGRTLNFTVAPNSTTVSFAGPIAALQTGTVAGTIQLTISLQSGGTDITPSPAPQRSIRVDRVAPAITSSSMSQTSQGFQLNLVGYSTTREVTQGTFHFAFANGSTQDVTVPMSDAAKAWFGSTASAPFGGQFSLSQPFTLQPSAGTISSVTVTLFNAQGGSAPATVKF